MTTLLTHDHCKISVFISVFKCLRTNSLISLVLRGPFLQGKTQIEIDLLEEKYHKELENYNYDYLLAILFL